MRGLDPWDVTRLEATGKPTIEMAATPCRHGPPLSRPIVGDVIGFALSWNGQRNGMACVSGDTVLYNGVRDVAIVNLGDVQFPITGPVRYSVTASDAIEREISHAPPARCAASSDCSRAANQSSSVNGRRRHSATACRC